MKRKILIILISLFPNCLIGQIITYFYDDIGRITKVAYPDSVITTYVYDASGNRISASVENVCLTNPRRSTMSSGNWNDPAVWRCGIIPSANDSAIITTGHSVVLNNSVQVKKLYIQNGAAISLNDTAVTFTIGSNTDKTSPVICHGTMRILKGNLKINGNLSLTNSSRFEMSGGKLTIDGNTGIASTSIPDGQHLFNVLTTQTNFDFSGGVLNIINPAFGANSQAINCPYNFGQASTLFLGDGISIISSNNINGFGGNLLPAKIGKMIFDPVISGNNRVFKNLNPLTIHGECLVKSGNLIQSASMLIKDSVLTIADIDNNEYPIKQICSQIWTAKNLEATHYRNGDTIPQVQDPNSWSALTTGAWCYYQGNSANGPVYGKLYNWYAVNDPRGLAPLGWHIPTNAEWTKLSDSCLGGSSIAGGAMKSTGLLINNTGLWAGTVNTATNSSGFSGLPSGLRLNTGAFSNLSMYGYWWSATQTSPVNATYYEVDQGSDEALNSSSIFKKVGLAVRCVKD